MVKSLTPIVCVICVTILETAAIWRGVDGRCFGIAVIAISGLGGYGIRELLEKRHKEVH